MKPFYWFTVLFFKGLFYLFHRLRIFGLSNIPEGPVILAPNHVSYYDPPIVGISIPEEIYYLARTSLYNSPIMNFLLKRLNTYPVAGDQHNLESFKIIFKLLKENKKVVVFPEGERSFDGKLLPIKSGIGMLAMRSHCPIVPVYIKGAHEVWPRNNLIPKPFGKISCHFGEPIYPQDYSHLGKKQAQEAIAHQVYASLSKMSEL